MAVLRNGAFFAFGALFGFVGCGTLVGSSEADPVDSSDAGPAGATGVTGASSTTPPGATSASGDAAPDAASTTTTCSPSCAGKICGEDDGCGGTCTTCSGGPGCNTSTGQCAACTMACGPHGKCVFAWEPAGAQQCQCEPGYYASLSGCVPVAGSPCAGVDCGPHGTCSVAPPLGSASCTCAGSTVPYGRKCAPLDKIRCVDRDGTLKDKGTIRCSTDDKSYEVCRDGNGDGTVEWVASGTATCDAGATCSACKDTKCDAGDGTGGHACPTGTICMSKVHETDVYVCVGACDCSNCGTCNPDQFTGWQRSCGSNADTFDSATKACASPCPHANEGCLPYGQFSFCFPNEGCASGAPQ